MKKIFFAVAVFFFLLPLVALADSYTLTGSCTDTTVPQSGYAGSFNFQYKINSGVPVAVNGLSACAFTSGITATPGDTVSVQVQDFNTLNPPSASNPSAWSPWVNVTAPVPTVNPGVPNAFTITITHQ
jgi:hypothetical protein